MTIRREKLIRFMTETHLKALVHSKDTSTKVGALILDPDDFTPLTQGYNGMPRGINESIPERSERPLKYAFFEHAERNALYNLARGKLKGSIAITTKMPNMSCVRALLSVGVTEVYLPEPTTQDTHYKFAMQLFNETGIKVFHTKNGKVVASTDPRKERKINDFVAMADIIPKLPMVKDPHADATVFIDAEDYTLITQGYSGFPRGADDSKLERYEGAEREQWVEGSIRNAVYNALRPMLKGALGMVTATTCVECARGYAGVGIKHVAYMEPTEDFLSRWGDSINVALSTMDDLGMNVTEIKRAEVYAEVEKVKNLLAKEMSGPILSKLGIDSPT